MSIEFLYNDQILFEINNMVEQDRFFNKPLRIAVAYWGKGSLLSTGLQNKIDSNPDKVRIICDLTSGSCNPNPIEKLVKSNVPTKTCDGMHAKVWTCGTHVILGSANVSTNGLGFDDVASLKHNHEASVLVRDAKFAAKVRKWFDELWSKSNEVNPDQLRWAKDTWKERNRGEQYKLRVSSSNTLLNRMKQSRNGSEFKNVRLIAWQESEEEPSKSVSNLTEEGSEAEDLYTIKQWNQESKRTFYDCSSDVWKFKKNDILLDFTRKPRGRKFKFNGIYRIVSPDNTYVKKGKSFVVMLFQESACKGYIVTKEEGKDLAQRIEEYLDNNDVRKLDENAGNLLDVPIWKFLQKHA